MSGCHAATVRRGLCAARRPGCAWPHRSHPPHPPGCFRREAAGARPASRNQLWFHFLLCHGVGGWQRGPAGQLRWAQRPGDSCSRHPSPALQAAAWGLGSRGTPFIPLHGHGGENPQEPRDLETGHHAGLELALPQQGHLHLPALYRVQSKVPGAESPQGARPRPCPHRGSAEADTSACTGNAVRVSVKAPRGALSVGGPRQGSRAHAYLKSWRCRPRGRVAGVLTLAADGACVAAQLRPWSSRWQAPE